jgi:hypothetical protein
VIDYTHETLKLYCEWLNRWIEAEGVIEHRYDPSQFTTYDPDNKLWGTTTKPTIIPLDPNIDLHIIEVTDGDEGGPAVLMTIWRHDEICQMTQVFDTMPQEIYNVEHGGFLRVPDPPKDNDLKINPEVTGS